MIDLDEWDKQRWQEAELKSKELGKQDIPDKYELSDLVADLMIKYGPDGHCDGHEIIAQVIWDNLKGDSIASN